MVDAPVYRIASDQIKEALVEARGSLAGAADFIRSKWNEPCTRTYVKNACETRRELLGFYQDLRDTFIDKAETNIFDAVIGGDLRTSLEVVKTLGKDRGWTQKQEVEVVDHEGSVARIQAARDRAKALRKEKEQAASEAPAPLGDPLIYDTDGNPIGITGEVGPSGEEASQ